MKDYLIDYFFWMPYVLIFYFCHDFFSYQGRKHIYVFELVCQIMLFSLNAKLYYIDIARLAGGLVIQIFFIIYVYYYYKDKDKQNVYKILSDSRFITLFFSGLRTLKKDEYTCVINELQRLLITHNEFEGKCFLFLSYNDKTLIIRYLFSRKTDGQKYIENKILDEENITEIEEAGKGMSLVYSYSI